MDVQFQWSLHGDLVAGYDQGEVVAHDAVASVVRSEAQFGYQGADGQFHRSAHGEGSIEFCWCSVVEAAMASMGSSLSSWVSIAVGGFGGCPRLGAARAGAWVRGCLCRRGSSTTSALNSFVDGRRLLPRALLSSITDMTIPD